MMDLEGEGRSRGAVVDRYLESLAVERMPRIDDRDGLDRLVLAVFAAEVIKMFPRSMVFSPWSAPACWPIL